MDYTTGTDLIYRAEQLLKARLATINDISVASARLEQARTALKSAEKEMSDAVNSASAAGWTNSELRALKIPLPARKVPGRSPRRRALADSKVDDECVAAASEG